MSEDPDVSVTHVTNSTDFNDALMAEIQQMHACLDALDDDRRLGWLWAAAWVMVGLTLGLVIGAVWLT